ncbi:hypothetical protein KEM48_013028 [Puccinia striiformis f. sp. tritici PST-130]|uniref:Uncharacterized protein n=1 Tax=Puccinia striiformis f. sp. tritici PST-78 TaxID=1165861 RepID=A0A0L0VW13_9BASI|nr:hypothetical protein KEM48_013028 [Puccinia striiformis f. sp. tritici PST-130]KNF03205.1 hypothetical protein PSTG_03792 [Puccinia striiformis f. sp. tritici PST-78]
MSPKRQFRALINRTGPSAITQGLAERQATIQSVSGKTLKTLESVAAKKLPVKNEMKEISTLVQAQLEKCAIVSEAKKESSKVIKVLDATLRDIGGLNDEIERLVSDRLNILRRCKLESISLPILEGSLRQIPMNEVVTDAATPNEASSQNTPQAVDPRNHGIKIDCARLDDEAKENPSFELEQHFMDKLATLNAQIEAMVPKTRALEKATTDEFTEIWNKRVNLFNQAYNHIKNKIHEVYWELTKGSSNDYRLAAGERGVSNDGKAYLELDDFEQLYSHGIKYSTMPPGKRY